MPVPIEKNVAIEGSSLYPRYRGRKNMPEDASRDKGEALGKDDEVRSGGRHASEERSSQKSKSDEKKRTDAEVKTSKAGERAHRAELEKELRETRESTKSTKEQAEKVAGMLRHLKEGGQLRDFTIDKQAADAVLAAAKRAYEGKGEDVDVVLETEVGSNQIGIYREGGKMVLAGLPDIKYKSQVLKELLKEAGIDKQASFPKDFDIWLIGDRQAYVAENFGLQSLDNKLLGYAPTPDPITPLPAMTGDLGIFERDMRKAIAPGRSLSVSHERLKQIEQDLDKAVRETRLKDAGGVVLLNPDTDANVDLVRTALRQSIEALESEYNTDISKIRGEINFDEQFGADFHNTIRDIETGNGASLRANMEEIREIAYYVLHWPEVAPAVIGVNFDVNDEATWPLNIGREDIRKLFEVTRALDREVGLLKRDGILNILTGGGPITAADRLLLEEFVSNDRNTKLKDRVNSFYHNIYMNLGKDEKKAIGGRIDENAATARASIVSGLIDFDRRMKMLFDVFDSPSERLPGATGALREWRGLFLIDGVEQQVQYYKLTQPPEHWQETPAKIYELITALEPSGLSPQDLQPILQAAYGMLNQIDQKTDFGRGMYFEMRELLEAFKVRQSIAITAHLESQDPNVLGRVFKEINGDLESTFTNMIARFGRDGQGRHWYDAHDKEVNLFDPAKKLYSERLREDRIKMNMVEEMTKYSIADPFNAATIRRIQEAVGYDNLPPARQATWITDLEETRQWLRARALQKIAGGLGGVPPPITTPISPEHPHDRRLATLDDWATEPDLRRGITKEVVKDWYERKTLHGAYGVIDEDGFREISGWDYTTVPPTFIGAGELADIFRKPGETDQQVGKRIRDMFELGVTWQQLRRAEMRQRIRAELAAMGLRYDPNVTFGEHGVPANLKVLQPDDLDNLLESGYIGSLDTNAYDITWLFEWSTYNMIHIYGSKGSKYDDDFKALVQNRASDLYFASIVDHNWEYLHPDFEDRGRGRQDDVNDVFRKEFIGKHKWLFGHVSMTARFIPSFLDPHDEDLVSERIRQLVQKHDFHNERYEESFEDYIRGVAIRELFVEGAISFADKDFSKVAAERNALNKFNPIDNAADRALVVKFLSAGLFQSYLSNPSSEMFEKMTTKEEGFMSTRDPRLFPWMEMGLKAHWEVIHNLNYKFFNKPDITNQQMENFVENMVSEGFVEAEQGEKFKNRNLGIAPGILGTAFFRTLRSLWEEERRENQVKRKGWLLRLLVLFFWTIPVEGLIAGGKGLGEDLKKQQQ